MGFSLYKDLVELVRLKVITMLRYRKDVMLVYIYNYLKKI